jgi:hypothetical protein
MQPFQNTAVPKIVEYSRQFFDGNGNADTTLHNKSTFLSPAHTHVIKHFVYRGGGREKFIPL